MRPTGRTDAKAARVPKAESASRTAHFADSMPGVEYFDANEYLCPDRLCGVRGDDGLPRYFDSYHMSIPESWNLGSRIVASDGVPPIFELGIR